MENKLIKSWRIILIIVIPTLFSCASTQHTTQEAPDEVRLRSRIQRFHIAMGAKDFKTWYEMTIPYSREKTLEDFKKSWGIDDKSPEVKMDGNLDKVCTCRPFLDERGKRLRCVLLVSIIEDKPRGFQGRVLETWEYIGREWYTMGILPIGVVTDCPSYGQK